MQRSFFISLAVGFCLSLLSPTGLVAQESFDSEIEETLDEEFMDLDSFEQDELSDIEQLEDNLDSELNAAEKIDSDPLLEEELSDDALLDDESLETELAEENPLEESLGDEDIGEELNEELEEIAEEEIPEEAPESAPEPEIIDEIEEEPIVAEEPELLPEPAQPVAEEDNSPEEERERLLNRMFADFSQRIGDDDWKVLASDYLNENYTIQRGDTLWDISRTFFGSGYFWPKLWQLNEEITNPHIIEPGKVLSFRPGSMAAPPEIVVAELTAKEAGETDGTEGMEEVKEVRIISQPYIPPPRKRKSVMKRLPPSLPYLGRSEDGYDQDGFAMSLRAPAIKEAYITVQDYLIDDMPETLGEVVEMENWDTFATDFHYIYIESETAKPGDKFLVVREGKLVEHPENGDNLGYILEIQGEIQIVYEVNKDDEIFKARVTRTVNPVQVGSKIIKGSLIHVSIDDKGPNKNVSSQIVGGRFENRRRYFGSHSTVFLNRGANVGLEPGDILTVRKNPSMRLEKHYSLGDQAPIGKLKIAHVDPELATAIVLESSSPIVPGDFTGPAPILSRQKYDEFKKQNRGAGIIDLTDEFAKASDEE